MWRVNTRITGVVVMVLSLLGGGLSGLATMAATAQAATSRLLIVGLQTASATSASEEYIALANVSEQTLPLDGVRLEYFAASPKSFTAPSRIIKLQGNVAPGEQFLLASTRYRTGQADLTYVSTLAAVGGHLRLVGPSGEWDYVGWGTAAKPRGQAAQAPAAGQELVRRLEQQVYIETGNNALDFQVNEEQASGGGTSAQDVSGLALSELLPDPAAPTTDDQGEFIEIYNGGAGAVELGGLRLVSGTTTTKVFSLPAGSLVPGDYQVFYAPQSKLTLGNSGGRVQLQTATGAILSETTYSKATVGAAWATGSNGGDWQWTTRPTPGHANELAEPIELGEVGAAAKAITKKAATKKAPKKTTSKAKNTAKTSVKAASTSKPSVASGQAKPLPVHNGVIAGVGGLAVLYGAYEYRYDAINLYRKLRGHREDR